MLLIEKSRTLQSHRCFSGVLQESAAQIENFGYVIESLFEPSIQIATNR